MGRGYLSKVPKMRRLRGGCRRGWTSGTNDQTLGGWLTQELEHLIRSDSRFTLETKGDELYCCYSRKYIILRNGYAYLLVNVLVGTICTLHFRGVHPVYWRCHYPLPTRSKRCLPLCDTVFDLVCWNYYLTSLLVTFLLCLLVSRTLITYFLNFCNNLSIRVNEHSYTYWHIYNTRWT